MNKIDNPRKALGKGLGALLPTRTPSSVAVPPAPVQATPAANDAVHSLPIDAIDANPHQPRRTFVNDKLAELAQSIRVNGIVQPLVVRRVADRYQIVAGERRWRAAKLAEVMEVPVVVREIPDDHLLEISLIENIQREDLNPIETAQAFARLGSELGLSPEQIGLRTGKDRSTVVNALRLLQLPEDLQQLVIERRLSGAHARTLLSLPTAVLQREVAEKAVAQGWSVRETERITQKMMADRKPKHVDEVQVDPNVKAAIDEMQRILGTKVRIVEKAKKGGRIEIDYYSPDDLNRIYDVIMGEAQ